MADIKILAPFILSFEGGFVDHPCDKGGATCKGVTLQTWQRYGYDKTDDGVIDHRDLSKLTDHEVTEKILRPHYWDRCRADEIADQSIANIIVDWVWASGVWGIKHTQRILGVKEDGVVGDVTLESINSHPAHELFDKIKSRRGDHFRSIVSKEPSQGVFLKGWLRRLDSIRYGKLVCNGEV